MPKETAETLLRVSLRSLRHRSGARALADIDFAIARAERLAIIGPNGSGKTTLLSAIARPRPVSFGDITLLGQPLSGISQRRRARHIAVLAQHETPDLRLALEDYVALGRLPHISAAPVAEHRAIVARAIDDVGLGAFRQRPLARLSGGERQRAALARVFAQTPDLLLLDEPTNHLDHPGRAELLALIARKKIATLAVLHDLPLVEAFADRVLLLSEGRQIVCGSPARVLSREYLYPTFGLNSFTLPHPVTGKTLRIFETPDPA